MQYPYLKVISVVSANENEYFTMNCVFENFLFEVNIAVRNAVLPALKAIFISRQYGKVKDFTVENSGAIFSTFFCFLWNTVFFILRYFVLDRGKTSRHFEKMLQSPPTASWQVTITPESNSQPIRKRRIQ